MRYVLAVVTILRVNRKVLVFLIGPGAELLKHWLQKCELKLDQAFLWAAKLLL